MIAEALVERMFPIWLNPDFFIFLERLSSLTKILLLHLAFLIILFALTPTVAASDDANSGGLATIPTPPPSTPGTHYTPSVNATKTIDAINKLSQDSNGTLPNSLLDQLKKDVQSGNNTDATQTIRQLQSYVTSSNGTKVSPALKDLVQSLTVQQNGVTVDPTVLKSLVGDPNQDGVPSGLTGTDPAKAANDLLTLANLLSGIDRSTASSFAQDSEQIEQTLHALDPSPPSGVVSIPPPPPISVNALNSGGLTPQVPQVSPKVGAGFSPGQIDPLLLLPVIAAISLGALLTVRRSSSLARPKRTAGPGRVEGEKPERAETGLNFGSARDMIVFYFKRAIAAMLKKGIPKFHFETHREFSAKCASTPEAEPIGQVASLYEKAMFSGREVTQSDVNAARENSLRIEEQSTSTEESVTKTRA